MKQSSSIILANTADGFDLQASKKMPSAAPPEIAFFRTHGPNGVSEDVRENMIGLFSRMDEEARAALLDGTPCSPSEENQMLIGAVSVSPALANGGPAHIQPSFQSRTPGPRGPTPIPSRNALSS